MAHIAVAAGPFADRRGRSAELRSRHVFAVEILDFYSALLDVQEQAHQEAISLRPSAVDLVAYVAERVLPAVANVSLAAGPAPLRDAIGVRLETADPREIVAAWVGGEQQAVVDRFLARASLGPVLEALGPDMAASCIGLRDQQHCPSCGGPPQLSYFAIAGED